MEPKITSTSRQEFVKDASLFVLGTVIFLVLFILGVWILVDVSTDLFADPIFHSSSRELLHQLKPSTSINWMYTVNV